MLSDLILFSRVKSGDIKSFEIIFRKYYQSLYYYSLSILKDSDNAEEVIQQLFYNIWVNKEDIDIRGSLNGYLYKSVFNQSLQQIKQHSLREKHKDNLKDDLESSFSSTPQNEMECRELETLINSVITRLPERRRIIYLMHKEKLLRYKEIAEQLSISLKTVEAEMTKTYKELKIEIEKYINDNETNK